MICSKKNVALTEDSKHRYDVDDDWCKIKGENYQKIINKVHLTFPLTLGTVKYCRIDVFSFEIFNSDRSFSISDAVMLNI